MAENTSNNPVDDLAAKSDFLDPAKIEQPAPTVFNFNAPNPVVNPIYQIKDNVTGVSPNYYPSQVKQDVLNNPVAAGKALFDNTMSKINNYQDRNSYGYAYGYDSSPKNTFRDRYKGYGQETFNKIGFNPLINNEAWFNQNTTFGDDLSRFWNHAAWPMLSKGFMDPINSYKSVIDGDGLFNADRQSAKDYEYYNAIGQSSKGGLGGFAVNLLTSASYSMGILLEGVLESVLIEGVVGGASPSAVAGGAAFGVGKFFNRLASLPKSMYQSAKGVTKLAQTMQDYSQIYKAKELFASAGKNFLNFANPLANTKAALMDINVSNINDLARASKNAGALWHDMMVMNLALSEGKLEGGFTKYQTYDKLYNKFMEDPENEGRAPSLNEQENMMKEAAKGSFWNTLNNTALIFYSNKLVFPSLTNASFIKGAPKFGFGTVLGDLNKEYQLVFQPGKNIAKSTFSKEKIGIVNAIKSLGRPSSYGKVGLNYFKANVVEGVQESLQDILQEATQNYYVDTYKNPAAKNFMYATGLISDAINKQFTGQGAETFLSGFLMGSILQAPSKVKSFMTMGYNDYFNKSEKYKTYIEEREAEAESVVEHMNTMWKNSDLFFDPRMTNYATQSLLYNTVSNPDEKTTKEIKDDRFAAFQTAVISSLQRGTFDMFVKHYEKYKQATPQDIEEAWNLQPGQGAQAIENFNESLESAKKTSYRYNQAKDKMKFLANLDDYEKDSYKYKMAKIYNSAYMQSLFNFVFLQGAYDDASTRLDKLYTKLASISSIKNSNFAEFAGLTDPVRLQREIEMMKTEVETLEQTNVPNAAAEISRKKLLLETYSNFKEKQEALLEAYINKNKLTVLSEAILKANPGLSKDQLSLKAFDKLIEQFDQGKSNEFLEYKDAFKNLIFNLAENEDQKLDIQRQIDGMDKGFDGLFDDLLDTHILKNEKNNLIPLINILSNPNDFYDHLLRNFQWMRNLYYNRKNIIKDIVNSEITNIERNALINELADKGIFVDLEEFAKWTEDPMYEPEYFIDVKNNSIIPKESLLYNEYYQLFEKAAELEAVPPAGDQETDSEKLKGIIDDITQDRDQKIDKARQKFDEALKNKYNATEVELRQAAKEAAQASGEDLNVYEAKLAEYKEILESLETLSKIRNIAADLILKEVITDEQLSEAANIILKDPANEKDIISLRDQIMAQDPEASDPNIAVENAGFYLALKPLIGDLIQEQQTAIDNFVSSDSIDVEQTEEWAQYQQELKDINAEFEELVKEAKLDFMEAGGNPTDVRTYSVDDSYENFPQELQEQLSMAFDVFLVDRLKENISLKQDDFDKYNTLRTRWQEDQAEASEIINNYNTKLKEEAIKNSSTGITPPTLSFGNAVIEPGTPLENVTNLYLKYETSIANKEWETDNGNKIQLTPEDIKSMREDMKAIAAYIDSKEKAYKLKPIAQEVIERVEQTIFNKQNELVVSTDEDGFEFRTFRDARPEDPRPERATEVATQIEMELEEKDPFSYNRLDDNSIQNVFREVVLDNPIGTLEERIDAFLVNLGTYKQFKSDKKLAGIKESLMQDQSIENLEKVVSRFAFKETSDAGINIDAVIRQFLTLDPNGGFMGVPYDSTVSIRDKNVKVSDIMSKDAYNYLFHPITGSVTRLRRNMIDGGYQLFSGNVKVFDRNARGGKGVTGELDLLLIDTNGNLAVVDIKAAQENTWKNLGAPYALKKNGQEILDENGNKVKNKGNKKTYFTAQQSIYRNSIYNMSGLDTSILLFPIEMKVTMDGYIEKLSKPTSDLSKHNKLSQNGMFIILEPLDDATMQRFGFERTGPAEIEALPEIESEEEQVPEDAIVISDPAKQTLNQFLNQTVMYQGKIGTLINNLDGGFSIEIDEDGTKSIIDINLSGKNVKDGNINIVSAGLSPIAQVESVGQVSQIAGTTINARFLDKNEKTAEINGIKYTINRDATGAIVSLTYYTNDNEITKTQEQITKLNTEISDLQRQKKEGKNKNIEREIRKKSFELNRLNSLKTDLINKNKKRTRRGGNADDLIFALNRLPNKFQKQVSSTEPTDREDQVNLIAQLSESESVTKEIDRILSEHGTTKDIEDVFDGKLDNLTPAKQEEIEDWGIELIIKLEEYQSRLANEQRSTVPVDNVIAAVNETLNNLTAIKFFKNGKITKTSRKEFEARAKVQQSTNVPLIQKSAGATTEGVSGQTISREDLEKRIQESRQRTQGISVPSTTPVSTDAKVNVKGSLAGQGTSIELEIVGDTGKPFLLTVDRKGNISLFSEKQPDGSYKSGDPAPKEAVINLYKKYVPSNTVLKIQKWLASFNGSWAASETEDGKKYDKAEKELIAELAALEDTDVEANVEDQDPFLEVVSQIVSEFTQADEKLETFSEGDIFLNVEPIGVFKKTNQTFILKSVDLEARTAELFSPIRKKSYTFTEQEIYDNFMRPTDEAKPVDEIQVTPQTKENVKSTEKNVSDLSKDPDALDKIEQQSENLSSEERLAQVKNIFNKC